jgi:CheY-like chemotaxis protein
MIHPQSEAQSALQRPHFLIVSDDEDLSAFLAEGLVYGGFWTSTVASGIQTLEVFRLRTFDLVLMDSALGDLKALEVVRRLKGNSDRAQPEDVARTDVPILIILTSEDELTEEAVEAAGANGKLAPPLDLETLVPTLHQFIQNWKSTHSTLPPNAENGADNP